MGTTMKKYLFSILPFFLYAGIVFFIFRAALFPPKGNMLFAPDILRYHYYFKPFLFQELKAGTVPLWNPFIMSGIPYLEHPQVTPWYVPNLLFGLLPLENAFAVYLALHIFIAMSAMFFLCRTWIGIIPSWTTGVMYGLSGYFVGRIYAGHIDVIAASAWLPLVLALFWHAMESPSKKTIIKAGVALAIQIFSGYQTIALFTLEAVVLAAGWICFHKRSIKPFMTVLMSVGIGLGIAAIQVLPNYQYVSRSIRTMQLPHAWSEIATPTKQHLLEFIDPFYFYSSIADDGLGHEHSFFFGKISLILFFVGCTWFLKKKSKRWILGYFLLLGGGALWISFGHNAPYNLFALLQKNLPLYSQIRIPSRHVVLVVTSMSVIAGFGLAAVKKPWLQMVLATILLVELVPFARHNVTLGDVPDALEDPAIIKVLRDAPMSRFLPDFFHGNLIRGNLEFNAPMRYHFFSTSGYDSPPLRNYYEFLMAFNTLSTNDILDYVETTPPMRYLTSGYVDLLNIHTIMIPLGTEVKNEELSGRFTHLVDGSDRGYRLFRNQTSIPRYFFVPQMYRAQDRNDAVVAVRSGAFDPRQAVIVEERNVVRSNPLDCPKDAQGTVEISTYSLNQVILHADLPCNGFITSSDVYYPGWEVYVDNKKTDLFEGNLAFRTLYISKGKHTVMFRYFPKILLFGAILSVIMGIGCIMVWYGHKISAIKH